MIITRFGDTYATAYELPLLKGKQEIQTAFRVVSSTVSGAAGEYDFYGENQFPLQAKTLQLKGELLSTTYAGVTTRLDAMKDALLAVGRSKLWLETRNTGAAVPVRWAYAKCIEAKEAEEAGENYVNFPVTVTFYLSEGVFYSQNQQSTTLTDQGFVQVINRGTYPYAPINLSVAIGANGIPVVYVRARCVTGGVVPAPTDYFLWTDSDLTSQFTWFNSLEDGPGQSETLVIASSGMSVKIGTTSYYADSSGTALVTIPTGQVRWLTTARNLYSGPTGGQGDYVEIAAIGGGNISAVANTTPIGITTTQNHGLSSGDVVTISGTSITDGSFIITRTAANTFTLNGTSAAGTASTGRWAFGGAISAITIATPPVITTSVNHGLSNDDIVFIVGAPTSGLNTINGVWKVGNVAANTFELFEFLTGSDYPAFNAAAYTSGAYYYPSPGATITASWYEVFTG